ncbi:M60 family metallopeptidase [Carboxylicivirga mesophila]|uniref:M60 family metallopeptidase n=1 Tax=Carboxylicivirga mesophila TaxID=1166478 RepID=A0ABS5K9W1_9BACT|nr:M60 family metallopeptidase [Carboxylicivirga mesophila]MBS2211785.1 M60 family metallopeptidase [Carboxylicivirga mesophila]
MRKNLHKAIFLIGIIAISIIYACSNDESIEVEIPKFEYIPGDPDEIINGDPEKVSINSLELHVNHTERASQPLSMAFDGDLSTKYHSPWITDNPPTEFPVVITATFPDNAPSFEFIYYWPRQVGSNGRIKKGTVKVSTKDDPENFINIFEMDYADDPAPKKIKIPAQYQDKIKKLVFDISSGVGDVVSIQEIEFYNEGISMDIPDAFTDKSCSAIKAGVEREALESISNSVFRNIALSLYDETYDDRRIKTYKSYPHPSIQSSLNKTSTYGLLDNVTGIYIAQGDELLVFAEEHSDELVVRIIDHDDDKGSGFSGQNYVLKPGVNKIKAEISGLIYLLYHNNSDEQVKVNFANGQVNGCFDIEQNTNEEWQGMLSSAVSNRIDLLGKYSHIIFNTEDLKKYTPDPTRLIEVYDSIVWLEEQFLGFYKYKRTNKSRMLFRSSPAATYMHATSFRTEYNPSTMPKLCDVDRLRTTDIWGPAHEVGHVNQTRPGFRWKNMANESVLGEVSNNVYSLYVQAAFGNPSRLETQDKYMAAYNSFMVEGMKHMDATGAVDKKYFFEQLVHFWQLELYFSQVLGMEDFYKDLHEEIRITPDPERGVEHHEFAYLASKISGYDLISFFDLWGYDLSADVKARIEELGYSEPSQPLHYIREALVDVYKGNKAIVTGTANRYNTGATYTFNMNGYENVVAYEVYVDDTIVHVNINNQFSVNLPEGSIAVLAIGADNNRMEVTF